jgi:hypothetical protein
MLALKDLFHEDTLKALADSGACGIFRESHRFFPSLGKA